MSGFSGFRVRHLGVWQDKGSYARMESTGFPLSSTFCHNYYYLLLHSLLMSIPVTIATVPVTAVRFLAWSNGVFGLRACFGDFGGCAWVLGV